MVFNKTRQYNIQICDKIIFVLNLMETNKVKKEENKFKKECYLIRQDKTV